MHQHKCWQALQALPPPGGARAWMNLARSVLLQHNWGRCRMAVLRAGHVAMQCLHIVW
jgi:hypothetical protein